MQTFLEVTNVTNNTDKNGRPFQQVTFSEVKYLGEKRILTGKVRSRNLWSSTEEIKGDTLYGQLQVGSLVEGQIMSFNTTTFTVNDRAVNKTTVVVFASENPVGYANQQLKRNGAVVVDEHGQLTAAIPVATSAATQVAQKVVAETQEMDF